jgi:hypothetical protein
MSSWPSLALALTARAVLSPRVALDLLTLAWAFRRRGWWHTPPFLPVPPSEYVAWRMHTAYGDDHAVPSVRDVLRFARWRRDLMRRW